MQDTMMNAECGPVWAEQVIKSREDAITAIAAEVWERTVGPRFSAQIAEAELAVHVAMSAATVGELHRLLEDAEGQARNQAVRVGWALAATSTENATRLHWSFEVWCQAAMRLAGLREMPHDERERFDARALAAYERMGQSPS